MRWLVGLLAAALLASGVAAAGFLVGEGLVRPKLGERYVSVKGLAEREVRADLALWPIRFVATGNDLAAVRAEIERAAGAVRGFVGKGGIDEAAVAVAGFEVTDLLAQVYRNAPVESRFVLAQTLMLRTGEVDKVVGLAQRVGDLVGAGVILSSENAPAAGPVYVFTQLNAQKPAMLAEATANAREAAQQFATDSGARLAGIRRASQGVFQILARDDAPGIVESAQVSKTLLVVSTVDYYLAD